MIEEVMLDREILKQLDRYDYPISWDDDLPEFDMDVALEELSQEALLLLP